MRWEVRDVDEETRRLIKIYAAENNLTVAQALAQLARAITKGNKL